MNRGPSGPSGPTGRRRTNGHQQAACAPHHCIEPGSRSRIIDVSASPRHGRSATSIPETPGGRRILLHAARLACLPVPHFVRSRVDKSLPYPLPHSVEDRFRGPAQVSHARDAPSRYHSPFAIRHLPTVSRAWKPSASSVCRPCLFGDMIAANSASCPSCRSRWEGSRPLNTNMPVPVPTYDHGPSDNPNFNFRGATYSPPMVWSSPLIRGCRPCRSLPAVSARLMIHDADRC